MANWYQKLMGGFRQKDNGEVEVTGGLEILSKLTTADLSKSTMLEKYRKSLYVFACINKIAMKVASVPIEMYKIKNSHGDLEEIKTHPALDLLYQVNPFQTKTEFMEITMINLKCTGDAFWCKIRNNSGQVMELWNLRPDYVTILTDPVNFIRGYRLRKAGGVTVDFKPDDIIHFKYPDPLNQYMGLSPLRAAQKRVMTEEYATQWQSDFFLNSARPDGLIKNSQATLTKDQKEDIRESWGKRHGGLNNAYKVAILEGGLEYQLISLSQKEMDYIESLKFTRDDILVAFQVPKPIVAIVDDVNRANSETAMQIFLAETIKPEVDRLWEKVTEQLISQDFGEEFFIQAVDPTPANRDLELKEYSEGITNRYLMINEVRALEGLPPVKGGWSFYGTLAEVPMGGLSTGEQKAFMKRLDKEEKENETRLTAHMAEKKVKRYNWQGKFWLKQKFVIYETMLEATMKAMSGKKKGKGKRAKAKFVSLLSNKEVKAAYNSLVNKGIDGRADRLKTATDTFFKGQMHRVLGELSKKKSKESQKKITAEGILKYDKEVGLSIEFMIPFIESYLKESAQEALNMLAPQEDYQDSKKIQKRIEKRAEEFAKSVNSTTLEKLSATLAEGIAEGEGIQKLTDRVEEVYSDFPAYRSEMIARTEATVANNEGSLEGFRQSGVATGKEWINSGDDRVREEHQDGAGVGGEIVALDKNFSNGLSYPAEPNCRCVVGPAFLEE